MSHSYVMNDQVRNLVPSLMMAKSPKRAQRLRTVLELSVFFLATLSLITALTLVA